ncbi:MAG: hypothetical protein QF684_06005 [Candidatus Thalassarchaeaceae archaeon]|jgi:hypothetical protein|nr:hypothetical protein [Candidatus Thalassarchaeaceae archaeon]
MQECDACGLLFGGAEECPSCGSRVSHIAAENTDDARSNRPTGPLPGESALDDAKEGIGGLDLSIVKAASSSSLPFQVGGAGTIASTLPFGVGAPAGIIVESEHDLPSQPTVAESPTEDPDPPSQSDDPWALPELENPPVLEATPSTGEVIASTPMLVLKARPVTPDEEQLSESPVFVENAFQINAAAFDAEHVYAVEEDVVIHDFGDELQVSEIVVNFDELVDPAEQTVRFDPEMLSGGEPELLPAKALPIDVGTDASITGHSSAAFKALEEGRWKDAADEFRILCNALPGDSSALNNFGLSLLQLAIQVHESSPTATPAEEPHFEAAVLALRQAAQQDKHNSTILYNLATCLATCGRHGVANRIWDAAISLWPEDVSSMNGKAVSLIAVGEFDAASSLLIRAREMAPSESIILRNLRRLQPTI